MSAANNCTASPDDCCDVHRSVIQSEIVCHTAVMKKARRLFFAFSILENYFYYKTGGDGIIRLPFHHSVAGACAVWITHRGSGVTNAFGALRGNGRGENKARSDLSPSGA